MSFPEPPSSSSAGSSSASSSSVPRIPYIYEPSTPIPPIVPRKDVPSRGCSVEDFTTKQVIAAMKEMRLPAVYIPGLVMCSLPTDSRQEKLIGPVYTVKLTYEHNSDFSVNVGTLLESIEHIVDKCPAKSILLIQTPITLPSPALDSDPNLIDRFQWSDRLSVHARRAGIKGIIMDGPGKPPHFHSTAEFPIFARDIPLAILSRDHPSVHLTVPIVFSGPAESRSARSVLSSGGHFAHRAGVVLRSGDYLVCDKDGVVKIPSLHVSQVFSKCRMKLQRRVSA